MKRTLRAGRLLEYSGSDLGLISFSNCSMIFNIFHTINPMAFRAQFPAFRASHFIHFTMFRCNFYWKQVQFPDLQQPFSNPGSEKEPHPLKEGRRQGSRQTARCAAGSLERTEEMQAQPRTHPNI
jgi:hypothetical protein